MRLLITVAGGYIGSALVASCLRKGFEVTALDRYYFGVPFKPGERLTIVRDDITRVDSSVFEGVYAVIDLAALSNDPDGDLEPELTEAINHRGRARIAELAKENGVKRYILSSSCSVYGDTRGATADENTAINPLTVYAEANARAEEAVLALNDEGFSVTCLRNATVYGISRRMRFDLVVNLMTLKATQNGKIMVFGGGGQCRPLVHIEDVAAAIIKMLQSEIRTVSGQVFNVGSNDQNCKIISLAYMVREALPFNVEVCVDYNDPDKRDYRVSFDKLTDRLGFACHGTVSKGVEEIYEALKNGRLEYSPKTVTVSWYKYLIEADKILSEVKMGEKLLA